jgi:hypothetical protein
MEQISKELLFLKNSLIEFEREYLRQFKNDIITSQIMFEIIKKRIEELKNDNSILHSKFKFFTSEITNSFIQYTKGNLTVFIYGMLYVESQTFREIIDSCFSRLTFDKIINEIFEVITNHRTFTLNIEEDIELKNVIDDFEVLWYAQNIYYKVEPQEIYHEIKRNAQNSIDEWKSNNKILFNNQVMLFSYKTHLIESVINQFDAMINNFEEEGFEVTLTKLEYSENVRNLILSI